MRFSSQNTDLFKHIPYVSPFPVLHFTHHSFSPQPQERTPQKILLLHKSAVPMAPSPLAPSAMLWVGLQNPGWMQMWVLKCGVRCDSKKYMYVLGKRDQSPRILMIDTTIFIFHTSSPPHLSTLVPPHWVLRFPIILSLPHTVGLPEVAHRTPCVCA
jgi:hypothetical protein